MKHLYSLVFNLIKELTGKRTKTKVMIPIVSTRFNDDTWRENKKYRTNHNIQCIYGSSVEMSAKIFTNSKIFVIEMNNTQNKIEGISLIKNKIYNDKYYNIYSNGDYNRYVYIGKYYINREALLEINSLLLETLENIVFKGSSHLKRGYGFTTLTEHILKKNKNPTINVRKDIINCFRYYYHKNTKNT